MLIPFFDNCVISIFTMCIAFSATVEECRLSIRTSTKYKYMNNWAYPNDRNGIHLATVKDGKYKGEVAYCIEFGKIWAMTGRKKLLPKSKMYLLGRK